MEKLACLQVLPLHVNLENKSLHYSRFHCGRKTVSNRLLFRKMGIIRTDDFVVKWRTPAAGGGNDTFTPAETKDNPEDHALGDVVAQDGFSQQLDADGVEDPMNKEGIMMKLKRYGVAGVLSYGILNTVYYLGMFLFFWFYVSPAPVGLGYRAAAERFIKLFAVVWAGSQVTKLPRAGCALALAPMIDSGLTWFTNKFKFESRGKAFGAIVAACFVFALIVFVIITSLWA